MKRILFPVLFMGLASAQAAEDNFSGFAVGLGAGFVKNQFKIEDIDEKEKVSKTAFTSNLSLEYAFPVFERMHLALGATYDLNKTKSGTYNDFIIDPESEKFKFKNHYSIYVSPGYLVQDDLLIYGKLAYHFMKVERTSDDDDYDNDEANKNFNGYGVGIGASYALTSNIEAGLEYQYIKYKSKGYDDDDYGTKEKPNSNSVMLLVKYRF